MDPNTEDLATLKLLKQTDPVLFPTAAGGFYALAGSIPPVVLEAFEALTPSVKYVKAQRAWCLTVGEWLSCRERLISKLMQRMKGRSLELGLTGASPGDLKQAPILSPWIAIQDPRCGGAILIGTQAGHPTLKGSLINTSRLCGIDPGKAWARTASRWYRLGHPATADNILRLLGPKVAALQHLALEFWQVQALIAEDQIYARLKDG
jgi:hypothetical protein